MLLQSLLSSCLVLGLGAASVLPRITSAKPTPGCVNGPSCRACWHDDYTVNTDSEEKWPNTGKTVHYHLDITNQTMYPDGTARDMLVINGQYPGPTLVADWGDFFEIDVTNSMQDNGTSIHWHGIVQMNTNTEDGVNGVTECPIPPGATRKYRFQATQYGTTWYHSHFSAQYGDGIVGTMVINGPASADYDYDLGVLPITDFYYDSMYKLAKVSNGETPIPGHFGPPVANNGLINGTNMNVAKTAGHYQNNTLIPGKKYMLRLVNTAVDNAFMVSIDKHPFTVVQADFVPIVPYETDWVFIAIGQRYNVIFTAGEDPGNYWMRAEVQVGCGTNANNGSINAIMNYKGVPLAIPTSKPAASYTPGCVDEPDLKAVFKKDVPRAEFERTYGPKDTLSINLTTNANKAFIWTINGNSMNVKWEKPTLQSIGEKDMSFLSQPELNVFQLPDANVYAFWIIQNTGAIAHPIHLHGHDFYLLGVSEPDTSTNNPNPALKVFDKDNYDDLNFLNPTRRDVAMLPGNGWMVIAFQTDNPGSWLLHCHIAWHASEGLALQFLERGSEIDKTMSLGKVKDNCNAWTKWYESRPPTKNDSGL